MISTYMDIDSLLAGMTALDSFAPVAAFTGNTGVTAVEDSIAAWHAAHDNRHFRREAMLVLTGSTLQKLEGKFYMCMPGDLFLIDRNEHHSDRYDPESAGLHVWLYILSESVICNIYQTGGGKYSIVRSCVYNSAQETRELHKLWDRIGKKAPEDIAELTARLRLLFCGLYRKLMYPENRSAPEDSMEIIRQYLAENCGRDSSMAQLSRIAGCSRQHLMRQFKKRFKCTVGEYIDQVRLEKSGELAGRATVKEIADILGFDSASAFCHWRRKKQGTK